MTVLLLLIVIRIVILIDIMCVTWNEVIWLFP